jgi:hypothetical protein
MIGAILPHRLNSRQADWAVNKGAGVCDLGDPTAIGLREAGYNSRPTRSEGPDSVFFTRQSKLGTSLASANHPLRR